MFDYNKRFWAKMFEDDDTPEKPNKTRYAVGMIIGLVLGGVAGWLLNSFVPLLTLGGTLGLWLGNKIPTKKQDDSE